MARGVRGERELARRWNGLIEEFTIGDAGSRDSPDTVVENESQIDRRLTASTWLL